MCIRDSLGDGLIAAVADGVLIGVDDNVALFLVVDHHRDNLILELAGVDGGAGAVVADDGQLVTFLPGDVAELGHVVGGHAHVAGDQGVVPVSYTHLDVYKRQGYNRRSHSLSLPRRWAG